VDDLLRNRYKIDLDRIYIYGYSAGGVGALRLVKERPGFFAAALSICGATGTWSIENLLETPIYMVHAADDTIVKSTYRIKPTGWPGNMGSADIYDRFRNEHKDIRYVEYPTGFMEENYGVNPHCSWVAVSDLKNLDIWEWLFSKKLKEENRWEYPEISN
jgi:predicted peptidase